MNVRKLVGRGLMAFGLCLMLLGTASVPSTSLAGPLAAVALDLCQGSCNQCGDPQQQEDETWECLKNDNGTIINGTCATDVVSCNGCSGGCTVKTYDSEKKCVCDNS